MCYVRNYLNATFQRIPFITLIQVLQLSYWYVNVKTYYITLKSALFSNSICGSLRYLPKLIGVRKTKRLLFDIATMLRLILFCCGPTYLRLVWKKKKNVKFERKGSWKLSYFLHFSKWCTCHVPITIVHISLQSTQLHKTKLAIILNDNDPQMIMSTKKAPFAPAKKCKKYTIVQ